MYFSSRIPSCLTAANESHGSLLPPDDLIKLSVEVPDELMDLALPLEDLTKLSDLARLPLLLILLRRLGVLLDVSGGSGIRVR